MKKYLFVFALFVAFFGLTSCSNDEDPITNYNGEKPMSDGDRLIATQKLVGVWEMEMSVYGHGPTWFGSEIVEPQKGDAIFQFLDNGILKVTSISESYGDTYLLPTGTYFYKIVRNNRIYIEKIGEYEYGVGDHILFGNNILFIYEIVKSSYNEYPGPPGHDYYFHKLENYD